jgi:hypothetical protein
MSVGLVLELEPKDSSSDHLEGTFANDAARLGGQGQGAILALINGLLDPLESAQILSGGLSCTLSVGHSGCGGDFSGNVGDLRELEDGRHLGANTERRATNNLGRTGHADTLIVLQGNLATFQSTIGFVLEVLASRLAIVNESHTSIIRAHIRGALREILVIHHLVTATSTELLVRLVTESLDTGNLRDIVVGHGSACTFSLVERSSCRDGEVAKVATLVVKSDKTLVDFIKSNSPGTDREVGSTGQGRDSENGQRQASKEG